MRVTVVAAATASSAFIFFAAPGGSGSVTLGSSIASARTSRCASGWVAFISASSISFATVSLGLGIGVSFRPLHDASSSEGKSPSILQDA